MPCVEPATEAFALTFAFGFAVLFELACAATWAEPIDVEVDEAFTDAPAETLARAAALAADSALGVAAASAAVLLSASVNAAA